MIRRARLASVLASALSAIASPLWAGVGDPQVKTDHPWYPGELACSTFERLFATQAATYKRVTGRDVTTDEDKALASWLWRNTHFAHGEEGHQDCFDAGFEKAEWNRDYWTGYFAHGFALCGTTHAQWTAEMDALLGHCRARTVGVSGHNSFEVYLTGGAYGAGKWALLDHDVSTVIYSPDGSRLLSIQEVGQNLKTLTDPKYKPDRQHGWRVSGLHDSDAAGVYDSFRSAEYLSGYAGPPPMVNLHSGESLTRFFEPGLEDGKTFVYWGMNYNTGGIPGLTRDRTWVNQPEKMFGSKNGTGASAGQVRFANAVFDYTPDFATGKYKEAAIEEGADHVTFEFRSPYVIGTTPAGTAKWGIYEKGGANGLVIKGNVGCAVGVSVDNGKTWQEAGKLDGSLDLTDQVKGQLQYLLRLGASPAALKDKGIQWRTVCQVNPAVLPRLHDGDNRITYLASGRALAGTGPDKANAEAHVVDGAMGSKTVTLELKAPRREKPVHVYAVGWQTSSNPPSPTAYAIDLSTDGGKTWEPAVKDWKIIRREPEPKDFWSQSFTWGEKGISTINSGPVRVRFSNNGGRTFRKVEAALAYDVANPSPLEMTFAWSEAGGETKTASHTYAGPAGTEDAAWSIPAGKNVRTRWVKMTAR